MARNREESLSLNEIKRQKKAEAKMQVEEFGEVSKILKVKKKRTCDSINEIELHEKSFGSPKNNVDSKTSRFSMAQCT